MIQEYRYWVDSRLEKDFQTDSFFLIIIGSFVGILWEINFTIINLDDNSKSSYENKKLFDRNV